ncbi:MAG: TIM-barrel protein yjbN family [Gammaproteobacteria bacterium]|nr:TIM-barrel protein yjbN family [Gammaproteobacteria bacterium]
MLDWTDRHCRYFHRLLTKHSLVYTEMITTGALLYGDRDRLLTYSAMEHPIAIQLGGSEPKALAACAKIAEDYGYDEVNLNVGCPSDRVQSGRFGACLMAEPDLVAECIALMQAEVKIPVTVKTRIGIDQQDSYEALANFIYKVALTGCNKFIVHARKAWLKGLSPKENREIPPLRYDIVAQLKNDFPHLSFILNGGIKTLAEIDAHLGQFDGVMLGREAYHNPYILAFVDQNYYDNASLIKSREQIVELLLPYIEDELSQGQSLTHISRHILGLFQGQPGARHWRRHLSENAHKSNAGVGVIKNALEQIGLVQSEFREQPRY